MKFKAIVKLSYLNYLLLFKNVPRQNLISLIFYGFIFYHIL